MLGSVVTLVVWPFDGLWFAISVPLLLPAALAWTALADFGARTRNTVCVGAVLGVLLGAVVEPSFRWACGQALLGYLWVFTLWRCWLGALVFRRRRLERLGLRWLRVHRDYLVVHADEGRRLLQWRLWFDEPVVAVEVVCPSTGEDYLLRVPPETRTCREAVAWTFSLPSYQYAPLLET